MPLLIETFASTALGRNRKVRVWLPDDVSANPAARFPVIFTADAQLKFSDRNEELPYGSWNLDVHLAELAAAGEIEPAVVVAVDNSPQRMKEYFPVTEEFARYQRFVVEDLIPWAREKFPIHRDAARTAHLGSSMGGLVSFALAGNNPEFIGSALCLSPWFEQEQNRYIHEILRPMQEKPPIRVYMDSGILDWRGLDDGHRGMLLARVELLRLGFKEGDDLEWFVDTWFPTEEELANSLVKRDKWETAKVNQHSELHFGRRAPKALLFFLGKK
ncbi:hypothetical protein BH09SUM1_BH09SUM1_23870 [soil metagenome]